MKKIKTETGILQIRLFRLIIILISIMAVNIQLKAQWQTKGPTGSTVNCMAVNNSYVYAGTTRGFFVSSDMGKSWSQVTDNNLYIISLFNDGIKLYASMLNTSVGGSDVMVTYSNGLVWHKIDDGLTIKWLNTFTVKDSNLYAGGLGGNIFVLMNHTTSWKLINTGIPYTHINALVTDGSILFAGTGYLDNNSNVKNTGIYFSSNNGLTWDTCIITNSIVRTMVIKDNYIFAGTDNGIIVSTDNGKTWNSSDSGMIRKDVVSLVIRGSNIFALTLGDGVYLSTDNGKYWKKLSPTQANVDQGISMTSNGSFIYVGTDGFGVWYGPISELTTSIQTNNNFNAPKKYILSQNYPNPFNPATMIKYHIPEPGIVQLKIYDLLGNDIINLVNQYQVIGEHEVTWNGIDKQGNHVASGVYFYQLIVNNFITTKKMIIEK